jgi:hypothetical protein
VDFPTTLLPGPRPSSTIIWQFFVPVKNQPGRTIFPEGLAGGMVSWVRLPPHRPGVPGGFAPRRGEKGGRYPGWWMLYANRRNPAEITRKVALIT